MLRKLSHTKCSHSDGFEILNIESEKYICTYRCTKFAVAINAKTYAGRFVQDKMTKLRSFVKWPIRLLDPTRMQIIYLCRSALIEGCL